jgi:hypothetical protein
MVNAEGSSFTISIRVGTLTHFSISLARWFLVGTRPGASR